MRVKNRYDELGAGAPKIEESKEFRVLHRDYHTAFRRFCQGENDEQAMNAELAATHLCAHACVGAAVMREASKLAGGFL